MANIAEYVQTIVAIVCALGSIVAVAITAISRAKALNKAKTEEERQKILNEIKSDAYGLITVAENLFSDIPKAGASKLLYVLNQLKDICYAQGVEYDQTFWTDFVNGIVSTSNEVKEGKELESTKLSIIGKVKEEIPYFIEDANKLFEVIPDSLPYKTEYILKLIALACEKYEVNVYGAYDWRSYVNELMRENEVA